MLSSLRGWGWEGKVDFDDGCWGGDGGDEVEGEMVKE